MIIMSHTHFTLLDLINSAIIILRNSIYLILMVLTNEIQKYKNSSDI